MAANGRSLKARVVAVWVAASLGFGLFSAVQSDVDSVPSFLLLTLGTAVTWGVPVTLLTLLVTIRWDRRRRERDGLPAKELWEPVTARETFVVEAPAAVAFARAVDAIGRLPKASVRRADERAGVIEGRVGMSWDSWGERLTVRVHDQGDGRSTIEVVSEPRFVITIADFGKNRRNVSSFVDAMR